MMDDDTLKTVTARILFESMTKEDRDQLVEKALATLLTEPTSTGFGADRRTRFQRAFDDALAVTAGDLIREHLKTPEVRAVLQAKISAAVEKTISGPEFDNRLAARLNEGLWRDS